MVYTIYAFATVSATTRRAFHIEGNHRDVVFFVAKWYHCTMTTITIPKEVAKNKNLVAVPREAFEEFLVWQKKIKSVRTFQPTAAERKDLELGRKAYRAGDYITLQELKKKLRL